jgi:hypothetical protein
VTETQNQEHIVIALTEDEALVLDAMLERFLVGPSSPPSSSLRIEHPAEHAVLWALQAALEKALVPPLKTNYSSELEAARQRVARAAGA